MQNIKCCQFDVEADGLAERVTELLSSPKATLPEIVKQAKALAWLIDPPEAATDDLIAVGIMNIVVGLTETVCRDCREKIGEGYELG